MSSYFIAALACSHAYAAVGIQAQEQNKDQDQTSQPQSGGRTEGSQSGGRRAAAQRQRQHMAMLAEKLNLTDAQKAQFQQIGKDMRKQGMTIRQDSSLTEDQKKEKMLASAQTGTSSRCSAS